MQSQMSQRGFDLGEEKYIEWEILPTRPHDVVVVTDASWALIHRDGSEESQGVCDINDRVVSALIKPEARGRYILRATMIIPPETLIEEVVINVD